MFCSSLDDLLLAGINLADNIVIVNKESSNAGEEDTLSDCNTIVAVQSIFRYLLLHPLLWGTGACAPQFPTVDFFLFTLKLDKSDSDRLSFPTFFLQQLLL